MKNIITSLVACYFCLLCLSCTSSDNTPSTQTPAATTQGDVQNAAKYSMAAMSDKAGDAADIKKLHTVNSNIDPDQNRSANSLRSALADDTDNDSIPFVCGDLRIDQGTISLVFNGSCENITGTVSYAFSGETGQRAHDLTFTEVTYEDCTINGNVNTAFELENDLLVWTYNIEDMNICDEDYNGSVTLTLNPETGEITYELYSEEYDYQSGSISVDTDIDYSEESGISGNATVNINGQTYQCVASGIIIDKTCGVPTDGTLTIKGADGKEVVFDFSNTTCENETVTYTLDGETHTYDLGEMATMIIQAS